MSGKEKGKGTKEKKREENTDPEFQRFKKMVIGHLDQLLLEPCDRGCFKKYKDWADTLYLKILDFKERKGVYPNIMLAQASTYDKIEREVAENPENLEWCGEEEAPDEFDGGLSGFGTDDFFVEFCLDTENTLKDGEFKLVFDEDPTFDGEEKPEDKTGRIFRYAA